MKRSDSSTTKIKRKRSLQNSQGAKSFTGNKSKRTRSANSDPPPVSECTGGINDAVVKDFQLSTHPPSMNWNRGIKAKIRTSLGGGTEYQPKESTIVGVGDLSKAQDSGEDTHAELGTERSDEKRIKVNENIPSSVLSARTNEPIIEVSPSFDLESPRDSQRRIDNERIPQESAQILNNNTKRSSPTTYESEHDVQIDVSNQDNNGSESREISETIEPQSMESGEVSDAYASPLLEVDKDADPIHGTATDESGSEDDEDEFEDSIDIDDSDEGDININIDRNEEDDDLDGDKSDERSEKSESEDDPKTQSQRHGSQTIEEDDGIGDNMMVYAMSNPAASATMDITTHDYRTSQPRILADLAPKELRAQIRYFYAARDPRTIDVNEPVRCLVCTRSGHVSRFCPAFTCAGCGVRKEHFSRNCPKLQKCSRCRTTGHDSSECKSKLKVAYSEVKCDLCARMGHIESECELIWRTSGRPWEQDLPDLTVSLFCYECGGAGHLGNDCPTRQPGKPMGSSTWSAKASRITTLPPQRPLTVKGRGDLRRAGPALDDEENDGFYRPKMPIPSRGGHIRIAVSNFRNPSSFGQSRSGPYGNELRNGADSYSSRDRPDSRPNNDRQYRENQDQRHRPSDNGPFRARSRSPGPSPSHRVAARGSGRESYRPLPSAAARAWKQGRY